MPGSVLRSGVIILLLAPLAVRSAELSVKSRAQSVQLSALGDRMLRDGLFDDAESAYSQALDLDRSNLQGHLGMGKIATLFSNSQRAAAHYSAAYQLAPRDPDAILAFAGVVENPEARKRLLRNFLALSSDNRAEDVKARLRVAEQIGTTPLSVLDSPYRPYQIPLSRIRTAGLFLRARINGGRELKLIVDTGATGIALNPAPASELNLQVLADAALMGFGSARPAAAHIARADSFETGGLKLANVLLNAGEIVLTRDADGLVGLDVFKDFLIRLDSPARTLELIPFPEYAQSPPCGDCIRAYRLGNLLLVRGTVNGSADGYFVLDTGSAYSMVSRKLVPQEGRPAVFEGAQGAQKVAVLSSPLGIRLGDLHLVDFESAVFDTAGISARNGTEIAGAIGYSLLRDLTLTVDYRAGLVKLAKPGRD